MVQLISSRRRRVLSTLTTFAMLFVLSSQAALAATTYSGNADVGFTANGFNAVTADGEVATMAFTDNAQVSGFSYPAGETIAKVTIGVVYTRLGNVVPHDDQIILGYTVSGAAGATIRTITPTTGALKTATLIVTPDRAWTPDDINNLAVTIQGQEVGGVPDVNTVSIDQLFVTVNAVPVASAFSVQPALPIDTDNITANWAYSDVDNDIQAGTQIRWYRKLAAAGAYVQQAAFNDLDTVPAANTTPGDKWYFTVKPKDGVAFGALQTTDPVTILPPNTAPVLDPIGAQNVSENNAIAFNVSASDANGDALTFSSPNLPAGAALDANTGAFAWTPDFDDAANSPYNVTFVVTDIHNDTDTEIVTFTVDNTDRIPTAANLAIAPGAPVGTDALVGSYDYADEDNDAEIASQIQWFQNGANVPALDNQLNVPANLTDVGDQWHFTVTPCAANLACGVVQTSADVEVGNTAPVAANVVIAPVAPIGTENLVGTYDYTDGDGDLEGVKQIQWFQNNVEIPELANQLTVTADFTVPGDAWHFTVTPQDFRGLSGAPVTSADVNIGNTVPVLDPIGAQNGAEGTELTFVVTGSDGDTDALTFSGNVLPLGAAIDPNTGVFTWTPAFNQEGEYDVDFSIADGRGGVDTAGVHFSIAHANQGPTLGAIGNQVVNENALLNIQLVGGDADGEGITYSLLGDVMVGSTFDVNTGAFNWTPDFTQAGVYNVTFGVTDGIANTTEALTITVSNVNRAPTMDDPADVIVAETENVNFSVVTADADGEALTYSSPNLPDGATFDVNTGVLDWTPSLTQEGVYAVTLTVTDTQGDAASQDVQITVNHSDAPPVLDAIGNKSVDENANLNFQLTASDIDGDAITFTADNLPAGATLDLNTGIFDWTPGFGQSGDVVVSFHATSLALTDSEDVTIAVGNVNRVPVLTPIGDQIVNEGVELRLELSAADDDGDAFIFQTEALPLGATLNEDTGVFLWTPDYTQSVGSPFNILFAVNDGNGGIDSEEIQVTVNNTNRAPVLTPVGNSSVDEMVELQIQLAGNDDDGDAVTYTIVGTPDGAVFDANTGLFTWTPTNDQSGNFNITFGTTDGSLADTEDVVVSVGNVDRPPQLDAIGNKTVDENATLTFAISGSDPDGDLITYSAINLPEGAVFDSETNVFTWTPTFSQSGVYDTVEFRTTTGDVFDSEVITITVNNVDRAPVLDAVGDKSVQESNELNFAVTASDPDGDVVTLSALNLPDGATFTPETGIFSWIPNFAQMGVYPGVVFRVSTENDAEDTESITITVTNLDHAPVLNVIPAVNLGAENLVTFTLAASDEDGDVITYTADSLPVGASLTTAGVFRWTPTNAQSGVTTIMFNAVSGDPAMTDSKSAVITVYPLAAVSFILPPQAPQNAAIPTPTPTPTTDSVSVVTPESTPTPTPTPTVAVVTPESTPGPVTPIPSPEPFLTGEEEESFPVAPAGESTVAFTPTVPSPTAESSQPTGESGANSEEVVPSTTSESAEVATASDSPDLSATSLQASALGGAGGDNGGFNSTNFFVGFALVMIAGGAWYVFRKKE